VITWIWVFGLLQVLPDLPVRTCHRRVVRRNSAPFVCLGYDFILVDGAVAVSILDRELGANVGGGGDVTLVVEGAGCRTERAPRQSPQGTAVVAKTTVVSQRVHTSRCAPHFVSFLPTQLCIAAGRRCQMARTMRPPPGRPTGNFARTGCTRPRLGHHHRPPVRREG